MNPGFHAASLLLHDEETLVHELAKIGFRSMAIQPRLGRLHPSQPQFTEHIFRLVDAAKQLGMQLVYDIDGCFLFDAEEMAGPSLASDDSDQAQQAVDWVKTWIDVVGEHGWAGSDLISFGSRAVSFDESEESETQLELLTSRISELIDYAATKAKPVRLAMCPRLGSVIAKVSQYERLIHWIGADCPLLLAADIGEMFAGGEIPVGERLSRNLERLACVYLSKPDGSRMGENLLAQVDFPLVIEALKRCEFRGPAIFRPSNVSHQGLSAAKNCWGLLDKSPPTAKGVKPQ